MLLLSEHASCQCSNRQDLHEQTLHYTLLITDMLSSNGQNFLHHIYALVSRKVITGVTCFIISILIMEL
jgi:hypothetical protein